MNSVNPRYKSIADNSRARLLPDKMLFCIYPATRLDRSLLKLSVILSCQLRSGSGCWGSGSWAGERSVYKIGISHWLNKLAYAALEHLQLCTWLLTNNTDNNNNNSSATGNAPKTRPKREFFESSVKSLNNIIRRTTPTIRGLAPITQHVRPKHNKHTHTYTFRETDRRDCHINAI